ncbi:MAG: efflux RND transporter permease subunit, partial [Cryomorphaceae bacterium]
MSLPSLSIKRPVLASVFSIALILFGIIGYYRIGLRDYPSVDPPVITVTTTYTGANSEVMISQVTEPLEESINGIDGIRTITSVSSDGRSSITVEFGLDVDLEAAANDVRDRVSRAQRNLPPDAEPPIVNKADANSQAIISLKVQSTTRDLLSLTEVGNNLFKERLQTINGVSEVRIWGEKKYAMRMKMDPAKMVAFDVAPKDVSAALEGQNVELPTGRIEGPSTELTIRTEGRLVTPEDFNNMIIREEGGTIIRFKDIGTAVLAAENERTLLRGDGGLAMIGIAISPQPGANYIEIADEFYRRLEVIKKDIPSDLVTSINHDNTIQIRAALKEVRDTVFIAFGLVLLVIFFFLRNWRSTLIPVITIPISLISTFFVMYVADFSVNILTLLGIVLGTGLVVDDAIVVLENIYKKVEDGMKPREAAFQGSKEIFFAVISTTVTLVAVFLPIMFLEGITGRLFREFGVVVAGAVVISSFVSLSLTPMMSSRLLKKGTDKGRFYRSTERHFVALTDGYAGLLGKFMVHRWVAILLMFIAGAMIFFLGSTLKSELAPIEDRSRFVIRVTAPEGTSFNYMNDFLTKVIDISEEQPETEGILSVTSPGFGAVSAVNSGFVRVNLVEPSKRDRTQDEIAGALTERLKNAPEARVFITQEPTIGDRRGGLPVQFVVQANTPEKIRDAITPFMEKAQSSELFSVVDVDMKFNKPEFNVQID